MSVAKRLIEEQLEKNAKEAEEQEIDLDDEPDYTDPRLTGKYKLKTRNRRVYHDK